MCGGDGAGAGSGRGAGLSPSGQHEGGEAEQVFQGHVGRLSDSHLRASRTFAGRQSLRSRGKHYVEGTDVAATE
jgi:hypothetical protein